MSREQPIRVLVVEAFEIMRRGLRDILDNHSDIQVIGEAIDVESALDLCMSLYPDVILMDSDLPGLDGLSAVEVICKSQTTPRVIALVSPNNYSRIKAIMQSKAIGCLTKNVTAQELIRAVCLVASGKSVMIQYSIHNHRQMALLDEVLTQREREVLTLLTHGLTNRQISEQLEVSRFTVKNHVSKLLDKLGATSRTEAATLALQNQLVQMD